ncbi:2-succinyl-5-enolpyruvyl-6-hydroxy-3-cyclohexene-1-carboxylic-acid synthase [Lujinxingia litoralis]|uniref:2-succinyl-5-enolpyruvyl-6-hydroxy-3-cyclohexene-1-carboxylate synthase n=1 Tax=Lujinxingia litoralis TaxID=2211119 RepID=A0A328C941_9DELT|nr:2-succinyl-5-enolpyruvyl-6-hydroxy-3-cyclohexene-1-carboxylic-acid synthase [Lujinxingia litoralis]RAL23672.1 2-succinyl-5-enolpyruvyl-6-hydroxy-3-cyclohexene-1-carboxylic-acid synthase [Lujinxingia litoralis]
MTSPTPTWPNVNTLWAQALVDELARAGLRHVCISPGSRSTPLVVAFANHPDIDDISIIDERQAAFFALGLSQTTGIPTALLCTSGTAGANYFPAICEASRSALPLLVLTADRPPHLHGCGAPQAMDQARLFGTHTRWFHQVAEPEPTPEKLRYLRTIACRALALARGPQPGPVHLNLPFRKPLEPTALPAHHRDAVPADFALAHPLAARGRPDGRPYLHLPSPELHADDTTIGALASLLAQAQRPLILAGADPHGHAYAEDLRALATRLGAPLIAEPTSGLRALTDADASSLRTGDLLFESKLYTRHGAPDLVLRTGKAPLNWAAARQARTWHATTTVILNPEPETTDPDHLAAWHVQAAPRTTLRALLARISHTPSPRSSWLQTHLQADAHVQTSLGHEFATLEDEAPEFLASAQIWHELGQALPDHAALFVSNSMPIRDVDTFMALRHTPIDVHFNRGVNGIDGIIASGLGVAYARNAAGLQAPTVIALGDVALRHDLSSLALAHELDLPVLVLVHDNEGGAIFDYLPIAHFDDVHTRHFLTSARAPIDTSSPALASVSSANTPARLRQALQRFINAPSFQIICARTERARDKHIRAHLRERGARAALPTQNTTDLQESR